MPDHQSTATRTVIAPGLIARISRAIEVVRGGDAAWFGPAQPMAPVAAAPADETQGRRFDYPFGWNQQTAKRGGAPVSFDQMRALADGYDLLRIVLETRKDQIAKLKWRVVPIDPAVKPGDAAKAATDFLACPDREHDFASWVRMLVEEMYVTDAACIYPRRTWGGDVWSLDLIDGTTINRLLDGTGRTPVAPDPAYQQILKGLPAINYTADELIYRPRNVRVWRAYGYSAVEQIITTVNIALRRQVNQLSFFTNGNVPSLIFNVPEAWGPDQIRQMQSWWDELTLKGRDYSARFIPGGVKPYDTREQLLKDDFDEWLARIVCFAFSVEPTPFVKQANRATAETARQQSLEEGVAPIQLWIKSVVDQCLGVMGLGDHQFVWDNERSIDPLVQAQIAEIYVRAGILSVDEARVAMGRDAVGAADGAPKSALDTALPQS